MNKDAQAALGLAPAKGQTWATMSEQQRAEFDARLAACRAKLAAGEAKRTEAQRP